MLPLPPIAEFRPGVPYPTPQQSKEDAELHGGVFTYKLGNGRITVFADPSLYDRVFHAQTDFPEISVNEGVAHIAEKWFQIPVEFHDYTRRGLDAVRRSALNPLKARGLNDFIGLELQKRFDALPSSGEITPVDLASATFLPVNQALFGPNLVPPEAEEWFHAFDSKLPLILYAGIDSQPDAKKAYEKIVAMFERGILRGDHLPNSGVACPGMRDRLAVLPKGTSSRMMAQFMVSLFWAPQANTLPMTFWTIVHILHDPGAKARAVQEALAWDGGRSKEPRNVEEAPLYDTTKLPFISACIKEVLRMYIAIEHPRKVVREFDVHDPTSGNDYRIPVGDRVTLMSYLRHYDDKIYPDPETFRPERYFDGAAAKLPRDSWFPFSKGRFSCSGQHLAMLEIPTLVALFLRDFEADLVGGVPEPGWSGDNGLFWTAPRCAPEGWPHNVNVGKIEYRRRVKLSKL